MPSEAQARQRFATALAGCYALKRLDLTPAMLEIWWRALDGYPVDDVIHAITVHVRNPDAGQYPIQPADVVRILRGSTETQALRSWTEVERAIRRVGPWQSVAFADAISMRVIEEMGGWIALCRVTDDELPFRAKEFATRYRGYAAQPALPPAPARLSGLIEHGNGALDAPAPEPVRLGGSSPANFPERAGSARNLASDSGWAGLTVGLTEHGNG